MSNPKPPPLKSSRRPRGKRSRTSIRAWLLAGTLIVGISVFTLGYIYYSERANFINLDRIREMPKASILYDYQGHAYSRVFEENRIALPADEPVPKLLAQAVIATEDRRFYSHGAIDPLGIGRAFWSILRDMADGRAAARSPSNWRGTALGRCSGLTTGS